MGCGASLRVGGYMAEFGGFVAGGVFGMGLGLGGLAFGLFFISTCTWLLLCLGRDVPE